MLKGILLCAALLLASPQGREYSGPKCLGPFCIGQKLTLANLSERLGALTDKNSAHLYRSGNGRAFLMVSEGKPGEVSDLTITDLPKYAAFGKKLIDVTEDLRAWKTGEGIGLGSSEEDILRAYGKPTREAVPGAEGAGADAGNTQIIYKGDFGGVRVSASFLVRGGKVQFIELSNNSPVSGPDCLGPVCMDLNLSARSLLKQLGLSAQSSRSIPPDACFQSQDGRTFLHVGTDHEPPHAVDEVTLSDFPNCAHMAKTITPTDLHAWKTEDGIGLASSEEDVVKTYGKPVAREVDSRTYRIVIRGYREGDNKPRIGDKYLFYGAGNSEGGGATRFLIRDGKVSHISLSSGE
jgi:hypothetical protein